jgi:hypothetical protein
MNGREYLTMEAAQNRIWELEAKVEAVQRLVEMWRDEGEKRDAVESTGYVFYSVLAGCAAALSEALEAK